MKSTDQKIQLRKKTILISLILTWAMLMSFFIINAANAQQIEAKNAVFFELGGNAVLYSVNYDRILLNTKNIKTSARIGFTLVPLGEFGAFVSAPLEVNFMIGGQKHYFETGLGYLPVQDGETEYWKFLRLGYRFQIPDGGTFFRVAYIYTRRDNDPINWAGISLGKSF